MLPGLTERGGTMASGIAPLNQMTLLGFESLLGTEICFQKIDFSLQLESWLFRKEQTLTPALGSTQQGPSRPPR